MKHDCGSEMSTHCSITEATGVEVFFTDAHSPWQKPLVERLNRELPRWLPRRLDLGQCSQAELDSLAARINAMPRKSMGLEDPGRKVRRAGPSRFGNPAGGFRIDIVKISAHTGRRLK